MQPDPQKPAKPAHHPRLYGDPDGSIQPTLSWGSGSVTIMGIPPTQGGHAVHSVTIDGTGATQQAANGETWVAAVGAAESGNSMAVVYTATLVYANTSFPRTTTQPILRKQG